MKWFACLLSVVVIAVGATAAPPGIHVNYVNFKSGPWVAVDYLGYASLPGTCIGDDFQVTGTLTNPDAVEEVLDCWVERYTSDGKKLTTQAGGGGVLQGGGAFAFDFPGYVFDYTLDPVGYSLICVKWTRTVNGMTQTVTDSQVIAYFE